MKELFKKHREIISYIFFGVITTLVSKGIQYGILLFSEHLLGIAPEEPRFYACRVIALVLQWTAGVLVAFYTNKKWVFEAGGTTKRETTREFFTFSLSRLGTLGLESVVTLSSVYLFNLLGYKPFRFIIEITADVWSMALASVVVIIANYLISKFIVFKKRKEE